MLKKEGYSLELIYDSRPENKMQFRIERAFKKFGPLDMNDQEVANEVNLNPEP